MNYWAESHRATPDGRYTLLALHQTIDRKKPPFMMGGTSMLSITKELYYILVAVNKDVFKAREVIKQATKLFDIPEQYKKGKEDETSNS